MLILIPLGMYLELVELDHREALFSVLMWNLHTDFQLTVLIPVTSE